MIKQEDKISNLIIQCIENFSLQVQLYDLMLELSRMQYQQIIEKDKSSLDSMLIGRKECVDKITELNLANKAIQNEIVEELELPEFALSKLKNKISEDQYIELEQVIKKIGDILNEINEIDLKSEKLLRQVVEEDKKYKPKVSQKQAADSYNNAMKKFTE